MKIELGCVLSVLNVGILFFLIWRDVRRKK